MSPFWLFLVLGVGLLAVELVVFQFTTFWLFFVGVGALIAAAFAWLGGTGYIVTTGVFLVSSALVTAVLFTPIKKWLKQPTGIAGNNAVGQKVSVKTPISPEQGGEVIWSGSDWQAELAEGQSETIQAGESAQVVSVQGIRLLVAKLD